MMPIAQNRHSIRSCSSHLYQVSPFGEYKIILIILLLSKFLIEKNRWMEIVSAFRLYLLILISFLYMYLDMLYTMSMSTCATGNKKLRQFAQPYICFVVPLTIANLINFVRKIRNFLQRIIICELFIKQIQALKLSWRLWITG